VQAAPFIALARPFAGLPSFPLKQQQHQLQRPQLRNLVCARLDLKPDALLPGGVLVIGLFISALASGPEAFFAPAGTAIAMHQTPPLPP